MLNIFGTVNTNTLRLSPHETGENFFNSNLNQVTAYYQNKEYPDQTSPLTRLIASLHNDEDLMSAYIRKVNARKIAACNVVGITTKVNRGFSSAVDGMPATEVFMLMNDSKVTSSDMWSHMSPIVPLRYKFNDCTMSHPSNMLEADKMIISIDVMNLMYMYKSYVDYSKAKELVYTPSHFLMAYVYTNMIGDFFRVSLLNHYLYDTPIIWLSETPFTMLSLKPHIRRMLRAVKQRKDKQALHYGDYLDLLPIMGKRFNDIYKIDTVLSKTNRWLWLAIYLPIVEELLTSERLKVHSKINSVAYNEVLVMGQYWLHNDSYFTKSFGTKDQVKRLVKYIKEHT